jgi:PAS domain S-box-containing protein
MNNILDFFKTQKIHKEQFLNLFKAVVIQNFEGVVITDPEGIIVYVNPAWENLTGYKKEEVVGKTTPRIIKSGKQDEAFYINLWTTIKGGGVYKMEIVNKRKDNSLYNVDEIIFSLKDESSRIIGFVGFQRDITERKKIELQLKTKTGDLEKSNKGLENTEKAMLNILEDARNLEEELKVEKAGVEKRVVERTKELFDRNNALEEAGKKISEGWMTIQREKARLTASINSLSIGFMMIDQNNSVVVSNAAVIKIMSLSENFKMQEIIAKFDGQFDLAANCQKCILEKKSIDVGNIVFGSKFLRVFLAPIFLYTGGKDVIGVVILVEDITEAKVLERSRDEFFSIASHELRTPLTSIRGNTSLILEHYADKMQDKDLKEMIDDIHESSVRLIEIVNTFLNLSRLEQGKIEFKKEEFSLRDLVGEVFKELDPLAAEKALYLKELNLEKEYPKVRADRGRTKEIFINLVGNSLKFTPQGGVTVSVEPENGFLKVLVSDTGRGIPLDDQSLLFRKFQQAGGSILTREATPGTGLGLYISKMMMEGMGGEISLVNSVEGKGTTFAIKLPIAN